MSRSRRRRTVFCCQRELLCRLGTKTREWLLVFSVFWLNFFQYGSLRALEINIPSFIDQLDMEAWAVGLTCSIAAAMATLPGPIWKGIADIMGDRLVIILGAVLMGAGLALSSVVQVSYSNLLFFSMLLLGIGRGLPMVSKTTILRHYFPTQFIGMNAIASTGGSVGLLVAPLLVEKLNYKYGWRGTLWIIAALCLNSGFAGFLMKKGENDNSATGNEEKDQSFKKRCLQFFDRLHEPCELFGFATVKRCPSLLIELIAFCILDLALYGWIFFQFTFVTSAGLSLWHASVVSAFGGAGSLVGRLLVFLLDKLMPKRAYARPVMLISAVGASVVLCLYSLDVSHWWWWGILSFLTGLFAGTTTPIYTALIKEKFPEEQDFDSAVGLHYTARGLGMLCGGPVTGLIYDRTGKFHVAFRVLAVFQVTGGLLVGLDILLKWINFRRYHLVHQNGNDSNNQPTTDLEMEVFQQGEVDNVRTG